MKATNNFAKGSRVQYYSTSAGCWVDTEILLTRATGEVQVQCKPGHWLSQDEQAAKLRTPLGSKPSTDAGSPVSGAAWTADQSYRVGSDGSEARFEGRVTLLDKSKVRSVHTAIKQLNDGLISCPEGFCVVYSASSQAFYLIYRNGFREKALACLREADATPNRGRRSTAGEGSKGPASEAELSGRGSAEASPQAPSAGQNTPSSAKEDPDLPCQAALEDGRADVRETFMALRAWAKTRQRRPEEIAAAAVGMRPEYRRSVFNFLCNLPARKPIFSSQAKEILKLLADQPEWRKDGVLEDATLHAALNPPKVAPGPKEVQSPASTEVDKTVADTASTPHEAPAPAGPLVSSTDVVEEETPSKDVLVGMPPIEAFQGDKRYDAGDTFKDFRKWARKLAVWDLAAAGGLLDPQARRAIFTFLTKICERRLYSYQGREMLSMLLSIDEWADGGVVDDGEMTKSLNVRQSPTIPMEPRPLRPPSPVVVPTRVRDYSPGRPVGYRDFEPGRPVQRKDDAKKPGASPQKPEDAVKDSAPLPEPEHAEMVPPPPPPPPPPMRSLSAGALKRQVLEKPAARGRGLRLRVEATLRGTVAVTGKELVALYHQSGLGSACSLSAQAANAEALKLILKIAGQRLRDLYTDPLQRQAKGVRVHLPHLYIDLQRRKTAKLPGDVQTVVEQKIRRLERWTCFEKAHVLQAPHEVSIQYLLAYALARAKSSKRTAGVWIPLGMNTGAQGHANAICLQPVDGQGTMKALIYDPNYQKDQQHWVHAQKAINDALPGVQKLLEGTGIRVVRQVELFGHGLQTKLGTTEQGRGWFSSKVYTTHQGYPICGAVVQLLASTWLDVAAAAGGALDDVASVEAALSEIASEPEGKVLVQRKVATILRNLTQSLSPQGSEPFTESMRRRLDRDRSEWPCDVVTKGGKISMSITGGQSYTYTW